MSTFVGDDRLIHVLRVYGTLVTIWPLDPKSGKFKALSYKILWCIYVTNGFIDIIALLRSTFLSPKLVVNITKILVEFTCFFEVIFNLLYCKLQEKQLQRLLSEIEQSDRKWTPYEEIIREKFRRYTRALFISVVIMYLTAAVTFGLSPLKVPDRMIPFHTTYIFPMSKLWGWCLAYAMHLLSIFQVNVVLGLDVMIIIILWNAAFKFNLLGMQMRSVFTDDNLRAAIITHQTAIRYAQEINRTISYVIVKLTSVIFIYLVTCNLLILYNVPFVEITQFFSLTAISVLRLYCYNWSAEMMTDLAYDISWKVYDTPWLYASPHIRQKIFLIIQRCQKPVVMMVPGFIPLLSIKFCGQIFNMTLSSFLALRAILHI